MHNPAYYIFHNFRFDLRRIIFDVANWKIQLFFKYAILADSPIFRFELRRTILLLTPSNSICSNINNCAFYTQLLHICIFSITGVSQRPKWYTKFRKSKHACTRAIYTLYEEPQFFVSCQNDTKSIFLTGPISPWASVNEWQERSRLKCFQSFQFHVLDIMCIWFTKL